MLHLDSFLCSQGEGWGLMRGGPSMTRRSQDLRRNLTDAERALWKGLRNVSPAGVGLKDLDEVIKYSEGCLAD